MVGGGEFCAPNSTSSAFAQLTVGNGDFAATVDLTGLQSLNRSYGSTSDFGFPALTQSSWGWHTPDPKRIDPTMPSPWRADGSLNLTYEQVAVNSLDERPGHGNRTIPYLLNCEQHNDPRLCHWWYNFPVRTSLGQLGFVTKSRDRAQQDAQPVPIELKDIRNSSQHHDLYSAIVYSNWTVGEHQVRATTVADDETTDSVAVQFTAPAALDLTVQLAFCAPGTVPIGSSPTQQGNGGMQACDWLQPSDSHHSTIVKAAAGRLDLSRKLEHDEYSVSCKASAGAWQRTGLHSFVLALPPDDRQQDAERTVAVTCRYALGCCVGTAPPRSAGWLSTQFVPSFDDVLNRSAASARTYWEAGAFVDLAGATTDPRAFELERIVVQSQALLRAMESGFAPPQESGLLFNSWSGKHHQEMRLFHQAWLAVWGRPALMDRSWRWFLENQPNATAEASRQGYKGQRVHKMVGEANPRGFGNQTPLLNWESANDCNPTLLWHQPWVILLAELQYLALKTAEQRSATLHRLSPLVFATADFLADFAERRAGPGGSQGQHYDLAPPLTDAAEDQGPAADAHNPTFELTQVRFALDTAIQWCERMGLSTHRSAAQARDQNVSAHRGCNVIPWLTVMRGLAPPPLARVELYGKNQTVYNRHQSCLPSVFAKSASGCAARNNHPAMLGAFGLLPGEKYGISPAIMNSTMWAVWELWEWGSTWSPE